MSVVTQTLITQDAQGNRREMTDILVPHSKANLAALGKTLELVSIKSLAQWLQKSMSVVESENLDVQEWFCLLKTCATPNILAAISRDGGFGGDSILWGILDLGVNIGRKVFKGQFGTSS